MYFGFDNISVEHNKNVILENLTLSVERGHITTIVGRNGCGKSTLLKTISRTVRPTSGHVILDGRRMESFDRREFARRVAYMPQIQSAPSDIDVRTLVSYGRFPLRTRPSEDETAVDLAIRTVGLDALANRKVGTLSGGERQRVFIAMQICREPDILVLDEPTTYLDIACQLELMDIITTLREHNMTILLVMHDLNLAARYSDRLAILHNSKIFAEGRPAEVLTQAALREVFGIDAEIVGSPPQIIPLTTSKG